jgi:Fe-S cluster biogenesis protein NfuA
MAETDIEPNLAMPPTSAPLEERIQAVLDGYRPTLYMDGGDVHLLEVDEKGIAHVKMLGACIDCPISLLTMKLGIQRLLKENFSEIRGVNAITDLDISALYTRRVEAN